MQKLGNGKIAGLKKLSDENGVIGALAIDQRGSLRKMIEKDSERPIDSQSIEAFKKLVSKELTPYASSILLDPEYGWPAASIRDQNSGLLVSYEKTGYDASTPGRLPDLLPEWSVKRLKEKGADAIKILLYYDVDEDEQINDQKKAFVERVGSECLAEDMAYFLEIVTYDQQIENVKGEEYAKIKPHKVINSMRELSDPRYHVDVLKVEVPVNMAFVEGYAKEKTLYTKDEAAAFFREQSDATDLPFIFLSAGVSAELFQQTLLFAAESGSAFNGILCGRATWKDGVSIFAKEGEASAQEWLATQGVENLTDLNAVIKQCAKPWKDRVSIR